jgi:hypothetical protein
MGHDFAPAYNEALQRASYARHLMQIARHPVDSDAPLPHCDDMLRFYTCPPAVLGT